jgi:hypothetical protein
MATIERRTGKDGQTVYRVKVRRKGAPLQTATFPKLTDARKWGQMTEGAVLEGRYLKTAEAKWHTLAELIQGRRSQLVTTTLKNHISFLYQFYEKD